MARRPFAFGLIVSALAAPLVAHAALAYPAGRLDSRLGLGAAMFAYAGAGLVLGLFPALFFDPGQGCGLCPANLVLVHSEPGLVDGLLRAGLALGLVWGGPGRRRGGSHDISQPAAGAC